MRWAGDEGVSISLTRFARRTRQAQVNLPDHQFGSAAASGRSFYRW
jgi:hypothetical protein